MDSDRCDINNNVHFCVLFLIKLQRIFICWIILFLKIWYKNFSCLNISVFCFSEKEKKHQYHALHFLSFRKCLWILVLRISVYGPWEKTAYPMFMHWSVSLGWLWNYNVVNQKASFLCTLYIYIYLYIVTVWYLAKCMTRIYLFSFYMQIDFIYSVCLKKNHDPSCLINQKNSDPPPLYQLPIFSWPPYLFAVRPPLEINNDRSLSVSPLRCFNHWRSHLHKQTCGV